MMLNNIIITQQNERKCVHLWGESRVIQLKHLYDGYKQHQVAGPER